MPDSPPRHRRRGRHRAARRPGRNASSLTARAASLVVLSGLIAAGFGLALSGVASPLTQRLTTLTDIRVPKVPPGFQTTFLYDRNGDLITTLESGYNRTPVTLDEMSMNVRNAVIAVEDKNYYRHGGVSSSAILRAAIENVTHRQITQGGSTITQQYVKNVYLNDERTLSRKLREAILAIKLEQVYTKNEILERYLNTVYFGNGAYGVEAAARTYWGIPAAKLNVLKAATLAGLIQAPSSYDPERYPERARERRNLVLRAMAQQHYIDPATEARLELRPVTLKATKADTSSPFNFFVQYVTGQLERQFGVERTFSGGLRVTTTLDANWQRAAENAVIKHLPNPKDPSAALVAIDPRNGAIRAMVGGRNFTKAKFNLAVQAKRQAGSSFKPFTLTAALEQDISLNSIWNGPPQLTLPDKMCYDKTGKKPWDVSNYADESAGTMNLLDAVANSVNTIFAQLVVKVGPQKVADVARRMGITSPLQPVCSITLGTQPVSPMEMADAYATLASRGVRHPAMAMSQVSDASGRVLARTRVARKRAISQSIADLVTEALEGVIQHGTGTAAEIGRPAAGKTGTAQNFQDAWFCGYTPQLAACVWVGYPKTEDRPMHNVEGFESVFGGSIPALIWHDFMSGAMRGQPVEAFANPPIPGPPTIEFTPTPAPAPSVTLGSVPPPPPTTPPPSPTPSPPPPTSPPPTPSPPPTSPPRTSPPPTSPPPSPPPTPPGGPAGAPPGPGGGPGAALAVLPLWAVGSAALAARRRRRPGRSRLPSR